MRRGLRRAVEGRVRAFWNGEMPPPGLWLMTGVTAPLAGLWGGAVEARNRAFDHGLLPVEGAPVPVVSVGNLAVGGTGKTPLARWVVSTLLEMGRRPGLVSRGYGEDELLLHRRWHPGVPVEVAPRRVEGARAAAAAGCDVVVLDDGFQHRRLARDLDLVLVSPSHPFPPRVLPRGPHREPLRSLTRAHLVLVVCKGRAEEAAGEVLVARLRELRHLPPVHRLSLRPLGWEDLSGHPAPPPLEPVLTVTSVARPESVTALVREAGIHPMDALAFPDHHPYRAEDVAEIVDRAKGGTVVTTEKDAVKLEAFQGLLPAVRVLPLGVAPGPALGAVRATLARAVGGGEGEAPGGRVPPLEGGRPR